jgi:hypothetical protein
MLPVAPGMDERDGGRKGGGGKKGEVCVGGDHMQLSGLVMNSIAGWDITVVRHYLFVSYSDHTLFEVFFGLMPRKKYQLSFFTRGKTAVLYSFVVLELVSTHCPGSLSCCPSGRIDCNKQLGK